MKPQDITRLTEIRDELYTIAERAKDPEDSRSSSPEQKIRRCSHALEDAIQELMMRAATQHGFEVTNIRVLRPAADVRRAA